MRNRFSRFAIAPFMVSAILMVPAPPASATPSTQATIEVSPAADLVDQLQIRVYGTGFRPNVTVAVLQCGSQARSFARCSGSTEVRTDQTGAYWTWFRVSRFLVVRNGGTIDCERQPGRCNVLVAEPGRWRTAVRAPITFDTPPPPTPPPPAPPPPAPLPPANPPADHYGLTWKVGGLLPDGYVHVGSHLASNPYEGDTAPEASLPIVCLFFDGSPYPAWFIAVYGYGEYNFGWARGWLATTPPVSGTQLTSRAAADAICASNLGPGWRMAEHHDPWFGNPPMTGQWNMWAAGSIPLGTLVWIAINDQYGNPWD